MSFDRDLFLPVSRDDMARRGWDHYDVLIITGDAYVDHPSFGPTIIGRLLEDEGYRVAILAQPDWRGPAAFSALGRPRLAVMRAVEAGRSPEKTASTDRLWRNFCKNPAMIRMTAMDGVIRPRVATTAPTMPPRAPSSEALPMWKPT